MELPGFIAASYVSQSPIADQEELYNWYSERMESRGASTRWAYYPTPGVTSLSTAASGPGSAHFFDSSSQREFAVIGTGFIEIDSLGVMTIRGVVAASPLNQPPATISSNGPAGGQIMITAGTNLYIFTLATNAFAEVVSMRGKAYQGAQLDGFFLVLDATTGTFYISDLLDGLTWDPTQFAQRSDAPDRWIALAVLNPYIYLFGFQTSSVWYNAGTSPFPFAPHPSGRIPHGIGAAASAEVLDGALYWVTGTINGNGSVVRTSGFSVEQVSTYPVEFALNSYTLIYDAIADSYSDNGHDFYIVTFPTANTTWVYDVTTQQWAKRGTWISELMQFNYWRPMFHAFAYGQHRMLDLQTANLYYMNISQMTDVDSRPIRRVRRAPALEYENKRLYYPGFELDLEPGLGTATGQGSNPQVMLRCSDDGGKTWSSERWVTAGAIGAYLTRARWLRCGSSRSRVFEVAVSDPIPWRLTNAYLIDFKNPSQAA